MKTLKKLHLKGANELSEAEMKQVFGGSGMIYTFNCKCFTLTPDGSGILKEGRWFEVKEETFSAARKKAIDVCVLSQFDSVTCN